MYPLHFPGSGHLPELYLGTGLLAVWEVLCVANYKVQWSVRKDEDMDTDEQGRRRYLGG